MEENQVNQHIRCPLCDKETDIMVNRDTVLFYFPLNCAKCGKRTIVSVVKFKMVVHEGKNE